MQVTGADEYSRFKLAQIWHLVAPTNQSSRNTYSRNCVINEILKDNFNINQKFTINEEIKDSNPIQYIDSQSGFNDRLEDCTVLHLLHKVHDIDAFTTLIGHGADFTMKNGNGRTALHVMITECRNTMIAPEIPFVNSVLSAHVQHQNSSNPHDNHGLSHLHGACMANHAEAAKLFLDNGASVAETVDLGASVFAGYTPLHFAAAFGGFKVAKILVERGANVNAQTAQGESPLDLLMRNYFNVLSSQEKMCNKEQFVKMLLDRNASSAVGLSALHVACSIKDLTMAERLLDEGADIDYAVPKKSTVYPGYTALHFAACNGIEALEMLLRRGANIDVTSDHKETPLGTCQLKYGLKHLCSTLSCIENLKDIRLSDGQTKLLDLISSMKNSNKFKQFLQDKVKDVAAVVPADSVLWPGYSILHLAVTFSEELKLRNGNDIFPDVFQLDKTIVQECLDRGLSVNVVNLEDQTPIHLVFYEKMPHSIKLMLEQLHQLDEVTNLVDKNNLSYLHIACYMKDEALVDRLLRVSEPNDISRGTTRVVPDMLEVGSTPLHAAVASGSGAIAELLLQRGADLHATDANGMTPIHWLIKYAFCLGQNDVDDLLLGLLSTEVVNLVDDCGLSYLHIACSFGCAELARKLIDLGSDGNAVIEGDKLKDLRLTKSVGSIMPHFSEFIGFTPLQMAATRVNPNHEVLGVLLRRGADIFTNILNERAKRSGLNYIAIENRHVVQRFFEVLWEQDDMQQSMEERFGLTKLHIACYLKDEEAIKRSLINEVNVNAAVRDDSVLFAGCTPLHLLFKITPTENTSNLPNFQLAISSMVKLLIDHGADVTIANAEKVTPIRVFSQNTQFFSDRGHCADILLDAHRDFRVNPANADGLSHFHLACLWRRVDMIEKFLQHGAVDVNQPIDYYIKDIGGYTPLHLALTLSVSSDDAWTKVWETVDLLLKYGAKVHVKDVYGDTPLHKPAALNSPDLSILHMFISYGGDINCENLQGQTPIEKLISMGNVNPSDSMKIFKQYGYRINGWNRLTGEGHIAKMFQLWNRPNLFANAQFKEFLVSSDVKTVDDMGRTALHNAVAYSGNMPTGNGMDTVVKNFKYALQSFIIIGIDIDHQDKSGQTSLHYAARMENLAGTRALLEYCADINIVDSSGKSALSYAIERSRYEGLIGLRGQPSVKTELCLHLTKLQHLNIEVSQLNQDLVKKTVPTTFDASILQQISDRLHSCPSQAFYSQVEMTKTLSVGINSLTLFDFLSDTGAMSLYPLLQKSQRDKIDHLFKYIPVSQLNELTGIIKLQFKKMRTRSALFHSATSSLKTLLGFSVPDLCEQISRFLRNSDLKNVIESTAPERKKEEIVRN